MESILIVSSSEHVQKYLEELVRPAGFSICVASSGQDARNIMSRSPSGIVIVSAPLADEFGHELCIELTQKYHSGAVIIVKNELAEKISLKVEDHGVFVLEKPVGKKLFFQSLRLVSAFHRKFLALEQENDKLRDKIKEIRLVDRAKCVLIQYLEMTEPSAHRYIEKQAMDMRLTRREIAENILKTYET